MTAAYLPADDPQVVGAYRFDGTDLIDAAGGEEFTATGTAVAQPSNTSGVYASDGSGGNDFAGDGTAVLYKTQKAVTVEGVVKLPTGYTDGAFICRLGGPIASGAAADNASWTFLIRPSASGGELRFASESGSGTEATVDSDAAAPLDEWIHVAFTRNAAGAIINLYINGVNVGSGTVTPTSGGGFAQGTADIGTGANGTVTVTPAVTAAEGVESNAIDVIVHADTNPRSGATDPSAPCGTGPTCTCTSP